MALAAILGADAAWAAEPISRVGNAMRYTANSLQGGAMALGIAGLLVIAFKAVRGKSPMDSALSWMGAMFVMSAAGSLIGIFAKMEAPSEQLTIYEQIEANARASQSPALTPGWNSHSIWGADDNMWGDAPGSGSIWQHPRQTRTYAPWDN